MATPTAGDANPCPSPPPPRSPMGLAVKSAQAAENGRGSVHGDAQPYLRRHQHPVPARSCGTGAASGGKSVSTTSGSAGSPLAGRSETGIGPAAAAATPSSDCTFLRVNHLGGQGDDAASAGGGKKKKRGAGAVGTDKGGRGLRQFSMKVCEKVESKGRTTYNEVADELVAEFADPNNTLASPDQQQQYDEKNIRRRVYDALNVLMAMDIISKDRKEIQWKGLPCTSLNDIKELKTEQIGLKNRIDKKSAHLKELEDQFVGLQKLIQLNEQQCGTGHSPAGGVALPFILVQTRPHATVEVEISEDMQLVHFDFNSTPFELHDDAYVLKAMNLCHLPGNEVRQDTNGGEGSSKQSDSQNLMPNPRPCLIGKLSALHPVPGILKGRLKHEL